MALAATSCVADNHPLGAGEVRFLADSTPIYAADVLDESGRPVLPRQVPFEKTIQLYMTNSQAADEGAFVDLQADPPIAFNFVTVDDTCVHLAGAFRCTAAEDGFATFKVRSDSDWSSNTEAALIRIVGDSRFSEEVNIRPAGLPVEAANFSLVIEGVEQNNVQARYDDLDCTLEPSPDANFDKWQRPRVREARVTATAPINNPTVIEHAPVIIQTLHPEVVVSLDPSCPEPRTSYLRVQLDATGNSQPFYLCFSDIGGGQAQIAFNSGGQQSVTPRLLNIDPEPRLLRMVTTETSLGLFSGARTPVSISVFDADLERVELAIDVRSTDTTVLTVARAVETVPGGSSAPALGIEVTPTAAGTAQIEVTPELFDKPVCTSLPITVTD